MTMQGEMHHDPLWVSAAIVIALVAATTALWFASRLQGQVAILSASLIMAVAVSSMHYAGMAGVHIDPPEGTNQSALEGYTAIDLMLPVIVGLSVFLLISSLFWRLWVAEARPARSQAPAHRAPEQQLPRTSEQPYLPRHGNDDREKPPRTSGTFDDPPRRHNH